MNYCIGEERGVQRPSLRTPKASLSPSMPRQEGSPPGKYGRPMRKVLQVGVRVSASPTHPPVRLSPEPCWLLPARVCASAPTQGVSRWPGR